MSQELCEGLRAQGFLINLVTETPLEGKEELSVDYPIIRRPSFLQFCQLAYTHDLVYSNGTAFRGFLVAKLCGKPFVWTHVTYRFIFPDGISVFSSQDTRNVFSILKDAMRKQGPLRLLINMIKLVLRRVAAGCADRNVAISYHMARCQSLPRQSVIYNPVKLMNIPFNPDGEFTFGFVGRLVSDKGVSTLLRGFALLSERERESGFRPLSRLRIVGSGPEEAELVALGDRLGIGHLLEFCGSRSGEELSKLIQGTDIFVIPSLWEEPMGVVAVELMSAAKPLIVSRRGALVEVTQGNCLDFENGNEQELALQMEKLRDDRELRQRLALHGQELSRPFSSKKIREQYAALFEDVCGKGYRNPNN